MRRVILAAALATPFLAIATPAAADDRAVVRALYERVLSAPAAPDLEQRAAAVLAPGWVTRGNNSAAGDVAGFLRAVRGFGETVPNLRFEVQEMIVAGERVVVRGRATGTPAKPFLGQDPTGKLFDVMSIDIHTLRDGRIVETFHVEDWAGALRQLRAN